MKGNLLVTFDPSKSGKAAEEVKSILEEAGEKAKFETSKIDGLFLLTVKKPKDAVKKIKDLCKKDFSKFECTYRWVPIEKWSKSRIGDMENKMNDIDKKMNENESWRLSINKRHFNEMGTTDLIMKLTEKINKPKVDLKNPQKIVAVEIIGKDVGISLLDADEILEVPKIKG